MVEQKPERIIGKLKSMRSQRNIEGMARFGINPKNTLGISVVQLRQMAKEIGRSHELALVLWDSGIHEARILACLVDCPEKVTEGQMEKWAMDFDSWDVCDQVCGNLFDRTGSAYKKASEWAGRDEEFVKRAGFVLMATLAVHDKKADDKEFEKFFPIIKRESGDDRNFVRKAVNWALRGIGKRSKELNIKAIEVAKEMKDTGSKTARWIASDALRELSDEKVQKKFKNKLKC